MAVSFPQQLSLPFAGLKIPAAESIAPQAASQLIAPTPDRAGAPRAADLMLKAARIAPEKPATPPLPDGAVISMESFLSRAADEERARSAAEKMAFRLKENLPDANGAAEKIRARYESELRYKGLSPQAFYDAALKIVREEIGAEKFTAVNAAVSQSLWVASRYEFKTVRDPGILERYGEGEQIPDFIRNADVEAPHTIKDIPGYLKNRLGETLIGFIRDQNVGVEIFVGPRDDMPAYYQNLEPPRYLKGEIGGLSSTEFYLFTDASGGNPLIVTTGISNRSRFRHQLWQFRYAGLDLNRVTVRGTFAPVSERYALELRQALKSLPVKPAIAVIGQRWWPMEMLGKLAGIEGPEGTAYKALKPTQFKVGKFLFDYVVVEVAGARGGRDKVGLIAMRMPNGSLAGVAADELINAGASHLLLAGAGGSLDQNAEVGEYQTFTAAEYSGDRVQLNEENIFSPHWSEGFPERRSGENVTVDTPLAETEAWKKESIAAGAGVVDVESYHVISAANRAAKAGKPVRVMAGVFISDVVGKHALVEKIGGNAEVYRALQPMLSSYLNQVGLAAVYDEKGGRHAFIGAPLVNPVLTASAQELPNPARSSILAMRSDMNSFSVLGTERRRVDYPDVKTMMAHKKIIYVSPPGESTGDYARFLDALSVKGLTDKVFLSFPPGTKPELVELARAKGVETVCIVDNASTDVPPSDYVIPKDTDLLRLNEALALNSHAAVFFDEPARHQALLRFMEREGRTVFISRASDTAELDRYEIAYRSYASPEALIEDADRVLKLKGIERWLAKDYPNVPVVPPSRLSEFVNGRSVVAFTGSSRDAEYDIPRTRAVIKDFLSRLDPKKTVIATTGSSVGAERLAHEVARELGFTAIGFFTTMGIGQPIDANIIVPAGFDWMGKSVPLLDVADALVTISGRASIRQELTMARRAGILTMPLAGSGFETDNYLAQNPDVPRYFNGESMARAFLELTAKKAG